jgi:ABC-2 type transport system ATP-binding protein
VSAPALAITDLIMRYGDKVAVDGLNLSVPQGVIAAVLGPNGAGKTTTLETCEGYRTPQGGEVRVLGLDPVTDRRRLLPRIGVMLQGGGAWSGVRATEMLRHVASMYAHPLDVGMLVDRLRLGDCGRTPYRRLSGGQRQRLGLAMALIGRPELVFVDEPTAGLDPQARRTVWALLEELRSDGVTTVLTTHFMEEAERLADQVFVVDHGRVVAAGTPTALTTAAIDGSAGGGQGRGPGQGDLAFRARPGLDVGSLQAVLPPGLRVTEETAGEYAVHGPVGPEALARVTTWCAERGVLPEGLHVGRRTLEDVFLELTGRDLQ